MTLPWLIRAVLVRGGTGLLLMMLTGWSASARPCLYRDEPDGNIQTEVQTGVSSGSQPGTQEGKPVLGGSRPRPVDRPRAARIYHRVLKGQNLYRIALQYGVTVDALQRANGIGDANRLRAGQALFIPVGPGPVALRYASRAGLLGPSRAPEQAPPGEEPVGPDETPVGVSFVLLPSDEAFSWPVAGGAVRSGFGLRHGRLHAGVDILAPAGSDVRAARGGRVVYSGQKFQGYGNVVMIDHGDGFTTLYAHNSKNLVRPGDQVTRGQTIAKVGATGNATGAHCHFEIRQGRVAVDPERYRDPVSERHLLAAAGGGSASSSRRLDQAGIAAARDPIP